MNKAIRTGAGALLAAAAGSPCWASGGGDPGGAALLTPQIGTIFWTFVTFICLVILLRKVAWKPLLGAIDAREKAIRDSIDQAQRNREETEGLLGQQRDLLAEARRERAEAVDLAKRDAEKVKDELLDQARRQRDQLLEQTDAQVQAGLRQARAELKISAVDLAISAAEKLLTRNLDDATQRKLVEEHLDDLERLSGDSQSLPS